MELNDLNNLDFEDIASWPWIVRIIVCILAAALLIAGIYWFDTKEQLVQLSAHQKEEKNLRIKFELRQRQAANLNKYKQQLHDLERSFGSMLSKLPSKTEVPGLLEDISNEGADAGLDFVLFDPQNEISHDFYVELPIKMSLLGGYDKIGYFISKIAALDRIVTLHEFDLRFPPKEKKSGKKSKKKKRKRKKSPGTLLLDITAKTYRYAEGTPSKIKRKKIRNSRNKR